MSRMMHLARLKSENLFSFFANSFLQSISKPLLIPLDNNCQDKPWRAVQFHNKMRILCLHGWGTNPEIMKRQMSALIKHCDPS